MNQNYSQTQAKETNIADGKTTTEPKAPEKEPERNLQVRTGIRAGKGSVDW